MNAVKRASRIAAKIHALTDDMPYVEVRALFAMVAVEELVLPQQTVEEEQAALREFVETLLKAYHHMRPAE